MALSKEEVIEVKEIFRQEANVRRQAKQNFRAAKRKAEERKRQAQQSSTPKQEEHHVD